MRERKVNFEFHYEIEPQAGDYIEVEIRVSATIVNDPSYGADADGNRGISQDDIDEFEWTAHWENPDADKATIVDVTSFIRHFFAEDYKAIDREAVEKTWEQEPDEPPEPEWDPDDDRDLDDD